MGHEALRQIRRYSTHRQGSITRKRAIFLLTGPGRKRPAAETTCKEGSMRSVAMWRQGLGIAALMCGVGLSGLLVPPAQAVEIHCGSVLGPGGSFKLEHDVGPCDEHTA